MSAKKTARKCLMGAPVPVFAQLIEYVKEVVDILAAAVGHSPAQSRKFLRRGERNQLAEQAFHPAATLTAGHQKKSVFSRRPFTKTKAPELA